MAGRLDDLPTLPADYTRDRREAPITASLVDSPPPLPLFSLVGTAAPMDRYSGLVAAILLVWSLYLRSVIVSYPHQISSTIILKPLHLNLRFGFSHVFLFLQYWLLSFMQDSQSLLQESGVRYLHIQQKADDIRVSAFVQVCTFNITNSGSIQSWEQQI